MAKFGKIWQNLVKLAEFGKIWQNFGEFGKIWENLGEFRRIWENLAGFGRIWKDLGGFRKAWNPRGAWRKPGESLGGAPGGPTTPGSVKGVDFGVSFLLYNKRMHYPPGQGLPQEAYYPKGELPPP